MKNKLLKKRLTISFLGLILGGVGYSLFLLIAYLFVFGSNEAVNLAAYTRYLLSYCMALFTFLLTFFVVKIEISPRITSHKNNTRESIKAIVLISLTFYLSHVLSTKVETYLPPSLEAIRESVQETRTTRDGFEKSLIWRKYLQDSELRAYIIAQRSTGYDTLVLIHTLYPTHITWVKDYSVATELYHNHPGLAIPWTQLSPLKIGLNMY